MPPQITLQVNGQTHQLEIDPETPLLYVLRNDLGLKGVSEDALKLKGLTPGEPALKEPRFSKGTKYSSTVDVRDLDVTTGKAFESNKDLFDFNPSPHSYIYYGVIELNELFSQYGFVTEFFGDTPVEGLTLILTLIAVAAAPTAIPQLTFLSNHSR